MEVISPKCDYHKCVEKFVRARNANNLSVIQTIVLHSPGFDARMVYDVIKTLSPPKEIDSSIDLLPFIEQNPSVKMTPFESTRLAILCENASELQRLLECNFHVLTQEELVELCRESYTANEELFAKFIGTVPLPITKVLYIVTEVMKRSKHLYDQFVPFVKMIQMVTTKFPEFVWKCRKESKSNRIQAVELFSVLLTVTDGFRIVRDP
jgi:hypothetical protein